MSLEAQQVLLGALKLPPVERAELVEKILASFAFPERSGMDALWAAEAEERIDAYDRGDLTARSASAIFERIECGDF